MTTGCRKLDEFLMNNIKQGSNIKSIGVWETIFTKCHNNRASSNKKKVRGTELSQLIVKKEVILKIPVLEGLRVSSLF